MDFKKIICKKVNELEKEEIKYIEKTLGMYIRKVGVNGVKCYLQFYKFRTVLYRVDLSIEHILKDVFSEIEYVSKQLEKYNKE